MIRAIIIALVAFPSLVFAVGCGGVEKTSTSTTSPTPPDKTVSPAETPTTPLPTPTPERIVTPTHTPTPVPTPTIEPPSANPVPGSCLVLEEKYCSTGVRVIPVELAFKLPEGVSIFSPFDGALVVVPPEAKGAVKGNIVRVYTGIEPGDIKFLIQGDLEPVRGNGPVREGELIAKITNTGVTVFGGYSVSIHFSLCESREEGTGVICIPNPDLLEKFFPQVKG